MTYIVSTNSIAQPVVQVGADGEIVTPTAAGATAANQATGNASLATLTGRQPSSTPYRVPSAAGTNNAANIKASAGEIYQISGYNAAAALRYVKFFNKASAPDPSADTPYLTLALPASAGFVFDYPEGLPFATGIGVCMVTGAADLNNTAVTAADILGFNVVYK